MPIVGGAGKNNLMVFQTVFYRIFCVGTIKSYGLREARTRLHEVTIDRRRVRKGKMPMEL